MQAVKDQVYEGFSAASHDPSAAISTTSISNNSSTRIPFRSNPATGVITVGQANGTVSMWSPAVKKPLLTMRCHNAPLTALAFERSGQYVLASTITFVTSDAHSYIRTRLHTHAAVFHGLHPHYLVCSLAVCIVFCFSFAYSLSLTAVW